MRQRKLNPFCRVTQGVHSPRGRGLPEGGNIIRVEDSVTSVLVTSTTFNYRKLNLEQQIADLVTAHV